MQKEKMKKIILLTISVLFLMVSNSFAATRYVRTDGGTGTQCDGLTDHALAGASGTNCALNSPMWVFPYRSGSSTSRAAAAGDTVVIGTGSYRTGCMNSSTCADSTYNVIRDGNCNEFQSYDCYMNTIPNNVTVVGCSTTGCGCSSAYNSTTKLWETTCSTARPEIWGAGRTLSVFNIVGATGITLKDLEITDRGACGEGHPTLNCGSGNQPTLLTAQDGIRAINSQDITFQNLYIHGLWRNGIYGGSVGNHTYNNVRLAYNSKAGEDTDSCNNDGTCGVSSGKYMTYSNGTTVEYNGCVESWNGTTGKNSIPTNGCYDQNNSGFGDGISATSTSGTWTFTDVDISHNFSDGLDLLYMNRSGTSGGTLTVKRSRFEGNIGNPFKSDANVYAEDNYIIGNCPFWVGKAYTLSGSSICRANGNSVNIAWNASSGVATQPKFYNNTITGNGDVMFSTTGTCTAGTPVLVKNNLLLGGTDYNGSDGVSIFYNSDGTCAATFTEDYNTCSNNFKEASPCPASHSKNNIASSSTYNGTITQASPYYTNTDYIVQLALKSSSTAIDAAITSLSGQDSTGYGNQDRGVLWDMGALDYTAGSSPVCGNGVIESGESYDDGNTTNGDGVSSTCTLETGWTCSGTPSSCTPICGDGLIKGPEGCDDGGTSNGNGCSSTCTVESGYSCSGQPSSCSLTGAITTKTRVKGRAKISGRIKF